MTDDHQRSELTRCVLTPTAAPWTWPASETTDVVHAAITSTSEVSATGRPVQDAMSPDTVGLDGDVAMREAQIRRRQIILKIEEYAAGYHRVTGVGYRYVAEIVGATPDEWEWIKKYIDEHPDVLELPYQTPAQWDEVHRSRGYQALQHVRSAADAGDRATALDHLDEARACGALSERDWHTMRRHLNDCRNHRPPPNSALPQPRSASATTSCSVNPPPPTTLGGSGSQVLCKPGVVAAAPQRHRGGP